tara:strand:+ start:1925 stop:2914 length:990 start_codon:yes stop_codon:yes gene_type:complete
MLDEEKNLNNVSSDPVQSGFLSEIEKIAALKIPSHLKGIVRESDAIKQFDKMLEGYRKGWGQRISMRPGNMEGQPVPRAHSKGFLTHDTSTHGGAKGIEGVLDSGFLTASTGPKSAQYTPPGMSEVYWHRGVPGVEYKKNPFTGERGVSKLWFRGDKAEGIHTDLPSLAKKLSKDRPHISVPGMFDYQAARTVGDYKLRKGDIAVLSAWANRNPKEFARLISKTKDRDMKWVSNAMQQEALRASQIEAAARQAGVLGKGQSIRGKDVDLNRLADYLEDIGQDVKLSRRFAWWPGLSKDIAKYTDDMDDVITDDYLVQKFLHSLNKKRPQ